MSPTSKDRIAGRDRVVEATRLYLHGPSVDEVLAQVSGGGATVDYLLKDRLGSTTALYRPGSGVQQRFTYDEYGAVQVRDAAGNPSAAAPGTRYLFTGREFDVTTGLYHYRHRWYHPETGRFVSPDPIGFGGGDINIYGYCSSGPLGGRDPSGLSFLDSFLDHCKAVGRNVVKAAVVAGGAAIGATIGSLVGGMIGSGIGGPIGTIVGGHAGKWAGACIGGVVADYIFDQLWPEAPPAAPPAEDLFSFPVT